MEAQDFTLGVSFLTFLFKTRAMDLAMLVFPIPESPLKHRILSWVFPFLPFHGPPPQGVHGSTRFYPGCFLSYLSIQSSGYRFGNTGFPHPRGSVEAQDFTLGVSFLTFLFRARAMDLAMLVFPTPGGPWKHRILPWVFPFLPFYSELGLWIWQCWFSPLQGVHGSTGFYPGCFLSTHSRL